MEFLNGYGNPRFKIYTSLGVEVITYDLGFKYNALREYSEDVYKEYISVTGVKSQEYKYSHLAWDLDLTAMTREDYAKILKQIIDYGKAGYTIRLWPASEKSQRYFDVIVTTRKFTLERMFGGSLRPGDRGFSVRFETAEPVYNWSWIYESEVTLLGQSHYLAGGILLT